MAKIVDLWVPDEEAWGRPRAIARGSKPPKPGRVFEVEASSADEARRLVSLALQPRPEVTDETPRGERKAVLTRQVEWEEARLRVLEVNRA